MTVSWGNRVLIETGSAFDLTAARPNILAFSVKASFLLETDATGAFGKPFLTATHGVLQRSLRPDAPILIAPFAADFD